MIHCQTCGDSGDGKGTSGVRIVRVRRLGLIACERCARQAVADNPITDGALRRLKRNRQARDRYAAMRSLGMVKTPYGWE